MQSLLFFKSNVKAQIFFVVCFTFSYCFSFSQANNFSFRHLTVKQGLSYPDVNCAIKSRDGFMWFGTGSGLNRFDGTRFEVFKKRKGDSTSLMSNNVVSLLEDENGIIWCGTAAGLSAYDRKTEKFANYIISYPGNTNSGTNSIFKLGLDSEKKLWVFSSVGLFQFNRSEKKFIPFFNDTNVLGSISSNNLGFSDLLEDSLHQGFWINTGKGFNFYSYREKKFHNYRYNPLKFDIINDHAIEAMSADRLGRVWYHDATDSTLCMYDFLSGQRDTIKFVFRLENLRSNYNVVRMMCDKRNNLYISTWQGYPLYLETSTKTFSDIKSVEYDPTSLVNGFARDFYEEPDGTMWICTIGGVSIYSPFIQKFKVLWPQKKIYTDKTPHYMDIAEIMEDSTGLLWFTADGGGLISYNKKTEEYKTYRINSDDIKANAFFSITVIDGEYWIGTRRGIAIFNPVTKQFRKFNGVYDDEFYKRSVIWIKQDAKGNIWFSNWVTGLYKYNPETKDCHHFKNNPDDSLSIPQGIITSFFEDRQRQIFLTSFYGISRYVESSNNFFNYKTDLTKEGLRSTLVNGIIEDSQGTTWAYSRAGGISIFDKKTGRRKAFTDEDGLRSNIYSAAAEDLLGNLWFGSPTGLVHYSLKEKKFENIDTDYGQRSENYSSAIYSSPSSGKIYAANFNNIIEIDPRRTLMEQMPKRVLISEFKVFENKIPLTGNHLDLSYKQNYFTVGFSTPSKVISGNIQYAYKLEGFDKDWIYSGQRAFASYTNVPGGDYVFKVKAADNKLWNEQVTELAINITPIFYETLWFRFAVAFIMFMIIRLYVRYRNAQRKQEDAEQAITYFANSEYTNSSPEEILWDLARNCISRLGFTDCVIYLLDAEKNMLVQKAALGDKTSGEKIILNPIEIPVGKGIVGTAAATGKTELIKDTSKDKRYIADDEIRLSEIAVPILNDGVAIGVIDSEHPSRNFFNDEHKRILETIASICATKIVSAQASQLLIKNEKKLLEVDKHVAEVRLMALRAQMNPHFIFNCLNAIDNYIIKNDEVQASKYLNKFARLIRSILLMSDKNFVLLKTELELLGNYIELENLRFEEKFSFHLTVDEAINADDIEIPSMLIQPFVENAIVHGLIHKKGEKKLDLKIMLQDENLHCIIEDNGIGRVLALQIKNSKTQTHESKGMKVTEGRLELLQQRVKEKGMVTIIDLKDEQGNAAGTRVEILIPLE